LTTLDEFLAADKLPRRRQAALLERVLVKETAALPRM
jgi:hypothetical protein